MVSKKLLGLISFCSCLYAQTPLSIVSMLDPAIDTSVKYITTNTRSELNSITKTCLLADVSKILVQNNDYEFSQLSLDLQRNRIGESLFDSADKGFIASVLFSIDWIKRYPAEKSSISALNFMTLALANIESDEALRFFGIDAKQRKRIVEDAEDLSEGSYKSDDSD